MSRLLALATIFAVLSGCGEPASQERKLVAQSPQLTATSRADTDGIRIVPPVWMSQDDIVALENACHEYLDTFRQGPFFLWTPESAAPLRLPLLIVFVDQQGQNYWDPTMRTADIVWVRGPGGRPLRTAFAPVFGLALALDHMREMGNSSLSADEANAATRCRTAPVTIRTNHPNEFE